MFDFDENMFCPVDKGDNPIIWIPNKDDGHDIEEGGAVVPIHPAEIDAAMEARAGQAG